MWCLPGTPNVSVASVPGAEVFPGSAVGPRFFNHGFAADKCLDDKCEAAGLAPSDFKKKVVFTRVTELGAATASRKAVAAMRARGITVLDKFKKHARYLGPPQSHFAYFCC